MKIGVIGAGRIGALHARTLVGSHRGVDLVLADVDSGRAAELAATLGCRSVGMDSFWTENPAGVVIASSSDTHAGFVNAALDAGIGVLCEKPLTTVLSEALEISERSRRIGVPVLVGFQRRFDRSFRALREEFAAGRYRDAYVLKIRHSDTGLPPPGYLATSASLFVDMCIHDFDAARWISGSEVETVSVTGMSLTRNPEVRANQDVDTAVSVLQLANGSIALVETLRQSPYGYLAEAEAITPSLAGGTLPRGRQAADWMEWFAPAFEAQVEGFLMTLSREATEGATARDATAALRIALAAERSYIENRVVSLGEIE